MRYKTSQRYELKYVLSLDQYKAVHAEIAERMQPDQHGDGWGRYPIVSLYFDTPDRRAYWDKIDGVPNRRKVRVRIYGDAVVTPETACYVEIKHRLNNTMAKRRAVLPYADAVAFDRFDELGAGRAPAEQALLHEVHYLYRLLRLEPACVVSYHRQAFNGVEPHTDLRVTFDSSLKGRTHDLSLLSTGHGRDHFVLPPEFCIMEVKANHNVPFWLTDIANRHRCTVRRFSKYCVTLERCTTLTFQRFNLPTFQRI